MNLKKLSYVFFVLVLGLFASCSSNFNLRDTGPAGGWIFYDKGSYSDGWRYLEAAPTDQSDGIQWYNGTYVLTGATNTAIGTGQNNTTTIVTTQGVGSYAAQLCDDLVLGGYDDWFLPSKDELNQMYLNLKAIGIGNFVDTCYWSSSEIDVNSAWGQYFYNGDQHADDKSLDDAVRCIRAF